MEDPNDDVVKIVRKFNALSKPSFLIEKDGRYYLTVAVLEYDPEAVTTDAQRSGVQEVQRLFEECRVKGGSQACEVDAAQLASTGMNTRPGGPSR